MPSLNERYNFAVYVAGIDLSGPYEDAFFEAGCDDATIVVRDGMMHLDFERQAAAFSDAVGSAMHDVEKAGGRILRIERIED
jgi:hypothetical protein